MRISLKLTLMFLFVSLIPLLILAAFTIAHGQEMMTAETLDRLAGRAATQEIRVRQYLASEARGATQLASRTLYKEELLGYYQDGDKRHGERISQSLTDLKRQVPEYDHMYVLDPDGTVVATTEDGAIGASHAAEEYFLRWRAGSTEPSLHVEEGHLHIWFTALIMADGAPIGLVAIKAVPTGLASIAVDYSGLRETGETLIARREPDGNVAFIAPRRFAADEAPLTKVGGETGLPTAQALAGVEGVFTSTVDYRGKDVFAATRYLGDVGWGIVVKMDEEEALEPIRRFTAFAVLIAMLTIALVGVIGLIVSQMLSSPITQLTKVAEDISQGKAEAQLDPQLKASDDEIGQLARAFERTIVSLKLAMRKIGKHEEKDKQEGQK